MQVQQRLLNLIRFVSALSCFAGRRPGDGLAWHQPEDKLQQTVKLAEEEEEEEFTEQNQYQNKPHKRLFKF